MTEAPKNGPLFDLKRPKLLQATVRRNSLIAAVVLGAIFAYIFWQLEQLWWLSACLFFAVAFLVAGTAWLVTWNPVPTVRCQSCGGRGWIDDLAPTHGSCPACGAESFTYFRYRGRHGPLERDVISGAELVTRREEDGLPWL